MIEKNRNLVIKELQRQEKVTDNSRPFLVVCILHNDNYDYFCYYDKSEDGLWYENYDIFTDFLITDNDGNFNDKTKILRYLSIESEIRLKWMNKFELINLKRDTIRRQIDEARNSETVNNLKLLTKELSLDCGKIVTFSNNGIPMLLVCALASDEDYYYLAVDKDFKIHYESCVGKYHLVTDEECISEMKKWQVDNNFTIKKVIEEHFDEDFEIPFTDYSQLFKNN